MWNQSLLRFLVNQTMKKFCVRYSRTPCALGVLLPGVCTKDDAPWNIPSFFIRSLEGLVLHDTRLNITQLALAYSRQSCESVVLSFCGASWWWRRWMHHWSHRLYKAVTDTKVCSMGAPLRNAPVTPSCLPATPQQLWAAALQYNVRAPSLIGGAEPPSAWHRRLWM